MLILASGSPRRAELLRQIGCVFTVRPSGATEVAELMSPPDLVRENALRKARDVAERCDLCGPVLGADTVVALGDVIFGKPVDDADAARMLRQLAGRCHEVYTGLALLTAQGTWTDVVRTVVEFAPMTDGDIAAYVATGEPRDKAGAYAIQGRAARHIVRIDGSFSNVVGLPLRATVELAARAGIDLFE